MSDLRPYKYYYFRYPWVASLQSNGRVVNTIWNETINSFVYFFRHSCTASVISPRALLTAAHCFEHLANSTVPDDVTAVVGINGK